MAPRSKRKFYPEFYTEEELSQIETPDNQNADENNIINEAESTDDTENSILTASQNTENEIAEPHKTDTKPEIKKEEEKTPENKTEFETAPPVIIPAVPPSQVVGSNTNNKNGNGQSTKAIPKSNSNVNGISAVKNTGNGRNTSTSRTANNTGERKSPAKKIDLKDIDKAVPDDIREKLYKSTGEKTETVRKKLDVMEKNYVSQKTNISNAAIPHELVSETETVNNYIINIPVEPETEQTASIEYNDYPFDDEPYKTMDMETMAMIMSGDGTPYNDNPYENENSYDDIKETVAAMSYGYENNKYTEAEIINNNINEVIEENTHAAMQAVQGERMKTEKTEIKPHINYSATKNNIVPFNTENALQYAHRWALDRNPEYLDFDDIGGDCTNYISQILLAGGCPMEKIPTTGWYYTDGNNKSPSWTGVEQLYKYLVKDKEAGIVAKEIDLHEVEAGDIVQLSFNGKTFQHTPFIVSVTRNSDNSVSYSKIKICAHSFDSENRPLDTYKWRNIRFIRVVGYKN